MIPVPFMLAGAAGLGFLWIRARRTPQERGGLLPALDRLAFGSHTTPGEILSNTVAQPLERPTGIHTNLARLRGKFILPEPEQRYQLPAFATTYPVTVVVSNDGSQAVTSPVRVDVQELQSFGPFSEDADTFTQSEPVTLEPGQSTRVVLRVPVGTGAIYGDRRVDATLRFRGFRLASSSWILA